MVVVVVDTFVSVLCKTKNALVFFNISNQKSKMDTLQARKSMILMARDTTDLVWGVFGLVMCAVIGLCLALIAAGWE